MFYVSQGVSVPDIMSDGGRSSDRHPSPMDEIPPLEVGGETPPTGTEVPVRSMERTTSAETVRPTSASTGAMTIPFRWPPFNQG